MRAFALESFDGPPSWVEIPDRWPGPGEVRVRVRSSSVNGFDIWVASGLTKDLLRHEFPVVVGKDFVGAIDAVGDGVSRFAVGDEVIGFVPEGDALHHGAFAQHAVIAEDSNIAPRPASLGDLEAGALTLAGMTALQAVGAIDPSGGQTVLVVGATGGVGSFVVQLAAARGATVIATGLPGDEGHLRDLGAAEVVDYHEDVAAAVRDARPGGIDGLVDVVNRDAAVFATLAGLVLPGGRAASVVGAADVEKLAADDVTASNVMGSADPADAARVAVLADAGTIRVPVQRTYPAARVADALADFADEHTVGKIAIDLSEL
jgi:NADPH:quinone reductase-like Zn-dependent oxidoreductase